MPCHEAGCGCNEFIPDRSTLVCSRCEHGKASHYSKADQAAMAFVKG